MRYIEQELLTEQDQLRISQLMYASVYVPLGWFLMARMDECLKMKESDFVEHGSDPSYPGQDIAFIYLTWRKTNQTDPNDC